jgi:para-aminobenzoate synthetase component I
VPTLPDGLVIELLGDRCPLLHVAAAAGLDRPAVLTIEGWQVLVADPIGHLATVGELERFAEQVGWRDPRPAGPPFQGGAVGYLTDDLNADLLSLPADTRPPTGDVGAVRFTVHDWCLAVDPSGRLWGVGTPARLRDLRRRVDESMSRPPVPAPVPPPGRAQPSMTRARHHAAVEQILEWVAAGDLYQANLTFQLTVPWVGSPLDLAWRLWVASPGAGHSAVLVSPQSSVVSVSPETFLRVHGDRIVSRPIKGTRARRPDPSDDAAAAAELRGSAKDHAEHVMIVDLVRNDLGRVCDAGSVTVAAYAELEEHPTVWHLTSTVTGQVRADVTLGDVLAATFPPGSVTGTPKRMAVARTRQLEPARRGVYCGAIGAIGPGLMDLSVAIRTAVVTDGVASYGTGGGIVADSTPDAEYAEAMAKAAAFLAATGAESPSA